MLRFLLSKAYTYLRLWTLLPSPCQVMASLIFDNVGVTTPLEIATKVKEAGGKIENEVELRRLEKGGVVIIVDSDSAPIAMCKMADWCASKKIRCHLPKSVLRGTVRLVLKNLPSDYEAEDLGPWTLGRFCSEKLPKTILLGVCFIVRHSRLNFRVSRRLQGLGAGSAGAVGCSGWLWLWLL